MYAIRSYYGIIEIDSSGVIVSVSDSNRQIPHIAGIEYFPGVIVPAFVCEGEGLIELSATYVSVYNTYRKAWQKGVQVYSTNCNPDTIWNLLKTAMHFEEQLIKNTFSAAKNINLSNKYGSIKAGKIPGLVNLTGFDFQNRVLTEKSTLNRII